MASILKHLRSSTADKRPTASGLAEGQIAINTASGSPGIFFKDSNSNVVKVGPVHVGAAAPNASPAGSAGNSLGELWVDNGLTTPGLNYYSGSAFVNLTPSGTTSTVGLVELATNAETQAGADAVRAVTSAGLQSKVSDSISTTSSTTIASATAVKTAYDLANAALPKSGGTVTGEILISPSGSLVFEGSSDDSFETTLAVTNPTADRTITLPNITGTVVTTGDTGSVTSTMIADGTIVNADINASAAISPSKLGSGALPSGVTVASANIVDGTIVNADVNASAAIAGTKISPDFGGQNVVTTGSITGASLIPSSSTVPTNGVYLPAANSVAISTAGSGRLFVDASGKVGLNTAAPDSILHISSSAPRLTFTDTDTGADHRINADSGAGNLAIDVDFNSDTASPALVANIKGTERLRITSAGLVGIGTSAPGSALEVNGAVTSKIGSTADASLAVMNTIASTFLLQQSDKFHIYTGAGQPIVFTNNNSEKLRITSAGLVGIGTSTPVFNLVVAGSGSDGAWFNSSGTVGRMGLGAIATGAAGAFQISYDRSSGLTTFGVGTRDTPSTAFTIDSSGRLGIGTTSPSQPLQVIGNALIGATPATQYSNLTVVGDSGIQAASPILNFVNAAGSTRFGYLLHGGAGADFYLLNQENGSIRFGTNNAERARIDSSGRLLVGTSSARSNFFNTTVAAQFQIEGTDVNSFASQIRNSANPSCAVHILAKSRGAAVGSNTIVQSADQLGQISFQGSDGTEFVEGALITAEVDGTPGTNDMPGRLVFSTTADGASTPAERMRIASNGAVTIGHSDQSAPSPAGCSFFQNGAAHIGNNAGGDGWGFFNFYRSTIFVGNISQTGTTGVSYNTASDYRLKENFAAVTDGITRLQQLKPSRFNFIAEPGKTVDGFIAHEVQTIVPEAITGEKDAVDDEGNPQYQGIDQSKLVPLLTAALQEAIGEIESLKARVAALEAN